jgi:hypothetical protein
MLAGKIADATGAYTIAYYIAAGLLLLAAFLGMITYINISVSVSGNEIVIKLRKEKFKNAA